MLGTVRKPDLPPIERRTNRLAIVYRSRDRRFQSWSCRGFHFLGFVYHMEHREKFGFWLVTVCSSYCKQWIFGICWKRQLPTRFRGKRNKNCSSGSKIFQHRWKISRIFIFAWLQWNLPTWCSLCCWIEWSFSHNTALSRSRDIACQSFEHYWIFVKCT